MTTCSTCSYHRLHDLGDCTCSHQDGDDWYHTDCCAEYTATPGNAEQCSGYERRQQRDADREDMEAAT